MPTLLTFDEYCYERSKSNPKFPLENLKTAYEKE